MKNVAQKNKENLDLEPYAVTNDRGFIAQKEAHDEFGYMSNVDRTAYNIVPPNSFAYNPARINVGSLGYYKGTENVIVSSLYEVFQAKEGIDDTFLLYWFKSEYFPRWIEKFQEGSVRLYFYFDKLVQCQMMIPSLEEQKRISACLNCIDNLITLYQRKIEALKKYKRGLLSAIFERRIRFKADDGSDFPEWEGVALGDVVKRVTRKNSKNECQRPLTISAQYGLVDQEEFFSKQIAAKDMSGYYLLKNGEFAYNKSYSNDYPIGAIKRLDRYESGVVSTLYICFVPTKIDSDFLTHYFESTAWHRQVKMISAEGARNHGLLNIAPSQFFETIHLIPSIPEQKRIAAFLSDFNKKEMVAEQQLEFFKTLRQGLLQQLFI